MASNKRRRHTPDQMIRKLAEGNKLLGAGRELGEMCRPLEIAESTWRRWSAQYGGMKGTEAKRLKDDWCRFNSAGSLFIDPGSPWQNAWVDSFNGRLRDEMLNSWRFDSLLGARVIIGDWRRAYNANRPHSGLLHDPKHVVSRSLGSA